MVIVPHEIHDEELSRWASQITLSVQFSTKEIIEDAQVLIVDQIGYLSQIYRGATFAYIGGAFGAGLHNTLEASVYGPTVFFGNKNYTKFKEARDLVEFGLAYPISDTDSLAKRCGKYTIRMRILLINRCKRVLLWRYRLEPPNEL